MGIDTSALLPGTLDPLILKALVSGTQHGYGIARYLETVSEDVLGVVFIASLAASYVPARRVLRIDPMQALRSE